MTFVLSWTGAIDGTPTTGTWSTAGNWTDLGTGVAALAAPATGDTVYIVNTNHAIVSGLSQAAVDLAFLTIGSGFTGQIGSSGTPLTIAVANSGAGILTYDGKTTVCNITAGTNGIAKAIVRGSGTFGVVAGTWTDLSCGFGGFCQIGPSSIVTGYTGTGGNATAAAGTTFTTVDLGAGSLISARSLGTVIIAGPAFLQTTAAAASTSVTAGGGSRFNIQGTGIHTLIKALTGSTVDAKGATLPFTVTTLKLSDGAQAFMNEMVSITIGTVKPYGYAVIL